MLRLCVASATEATLVKVADPVLTVMLVTVVVYAAVFAIKKRVLRVNVVERAAVPEVTEAPEVFFDCTTAQAI